MTGSGHDLEFDIRLAISEYVELNTHVIERMSGTESVAQRVLDSIEQALAAVRSPLGPNIPSATLRFRTIPEEYLEPALELFTARTLEALLPNLIDFEERLETLTGMAADAEPSSRAAATLANLSRCYLFGFDGETIAMCRAAVDVAVSDAVAMLPNATSLGGAFMWQKVAALRAAGALDETTEKDALAVWKWGNDILHSDVRKVASAPHAVRKTIGVVAALFPPT